MRRSTLKCHSCTSALKINVRIGIRISALQPFDMDAVAASQMPSHSTISASPPGGMRRWAREDIAGAPVAERAKRDAYVVLRLHPGVAAHAEADDAVGVILTYDAD